MSVLQRSLAVRPNQPNQRSLVPSPLVQAAVVPSLVWTEARDVMRTRTLTIRKRLLSLSAQKFISDLSRDAFHFAKLRVNGTTAGRGRPATAVDRNRVVLTMDDLSLALSEHGVNVKKPDYCELIPSPKLTCRPVINPYNPPPSALTLGCEVQPSADRLAAPSRAVN